MFILWLQLIAMNKIIYPVILSLCLISSVTAQERWSLQRCVEYALEHSISLESSKLNVKDAEIVNNAAWQQRLPSLNGSTGYNLSFGRRINPATNDFLNERFGNQSISVSSGVLLYNGGRISNQIKQAKINQESSILDLRQLENDISLNVANSFLNILFARENAQNARNSLALTQSQYEQIEKLIAAGSRPRNAGLELLAQIAAGEQAVIAAENDGVLSMLALRQLLQLEDEVEFDIEIPALTAPTDYDIESLNSQDIYQFAKLNQPNIKAGELRAQSAELGVAVAKSGLLPSLSIGGGLGSNFASVAARQGEATGFEFMNSPALLNGEPVNIGLPFPTFGSPVKTPYFDQINENFGYQVGLQLSVPIFNQGQNKVNLERAKLDVRRTQVANQEIKNNLKSLIERAAADVKAAKLQYEAALRTREAAEASYSDTQKRFDLGVSNSFELTTAINNRDRADVDVLIAKYDFIFKSKVIDFYQGKVITLN